MNEVPAIQTHNYCPDKKCGSPKGGVASIRKMCQLMERCEVHYRDYLTHTRMKSLGNPLNIAVGFMNKIYKR